MPARSVPVPLASVDIAMVALIADASPYVAAGFGLVGTVIGGVIASTVSLRLAREAQHAAESAWIRENRREIYDRVLTSAQKLLIACEHRHDRDHRDQAGEDVQEAFVDFFNAYGVVQTVAARPVVAAVRVYASRLLELKEMLDSAGTL